MRKAILMMLLAVVSSSAVAALWKCTDAGGAVYYLPEAVTDGSKTCIALVSDEVKPTEPQEADPQQAQQRATEASEKCVAAYMSDQEIRVLVGKMTLLSGEKVTPAMLALNRKATPIERKALEKYISQSNRCADAYFQALNLPPINWNDPDLQTILPPQLKLRDGQITFADYARWEIKSKREWERSQKEREVLKRQVAEQERRRQEELSRPITLSCIVDMQGISGTIPRMNGVEWQYQINEAAQTIWASRGTAPTEIRISPTEISFKQGDQAVSIGRSTGRIAIIGGILGTGQCQTITQRQF